jgi:hypothetical protein
MGKRVRSVKAAKRVDGCDECGEAHRMPDGLPGCTAHRSSSGRSVRCKARPVNGSPVCKTHGGVAKQTKAAGLARIQFAQAEGEIAALLRAVDLPEQHPIDGLLEAVRHTGAMMRMLGYFVSQLKRDPTVNTYVTEDGVEKVAADDALWGVNHVGDTAPHVLVGLYEKWVALHVRACKTALEAGIDERRIRLEEQQTDVMFEAVSAGMRALNLTPDQRTIFNQAVADSLRGMKVLEAG